MSFDFDKAEKAAEAESDRPEANIAAVVLGATSAGKSFLAGTMPGKTLFLYMQGEEHGKDSAKLAASEYGGKVVPDCLDIETLDDGTSKPRTPDAAYKRLLAGLKDGATMKAKGYDNVALDGLTELEQLVRGTTEWADICQTKKGEHDKWKEIDATTRMIRRVLDALRSLQRDYGINYYVTCLLMVREKDESGEILDAEPKLIGYELAAQLIPQFPDQIAIGRMVNSKGEEAHRLQFGAKITKKAKEKSGEIKKLIGFTPRLRGVPSDKLPSTMAADFSEVLKLKEGGE